MTLADRRSPLGVAENEPRPTPNGQQPTFSVVIPTHNRIAMLQRVLEALGQQRDAPEFETIVINDGSTDDTDKILSQRSGITFRTQANSGPGRARNHGVSLARGRFVIFIGDDTVPEPGFVAEHARTHRDSSDDP